MVGTGLAPPLGWGSIWGRYLHPQAGGTAMSTHARDTKSIPEETACLAHATYPAGTFAMYLRDELGDVLDEPFALLFRSPGNPADAPWRLPVVLVLQYIEKLTDQQAADAVRTRVDWKHALG